MTTKFMSNLSRTFSNSGFSRTYSSAPKPFHFTKLEQTPLPTPATAPKPKPRRDRRRSGMAVCCCCFTACVSMLITAVIVLGIAALIIWLVLRPIHTPTYDLNEVAISRLGYTPTPNHTLDASANYTIVSYNGNGKIGIKYESIGVDTSYQGLVFSHQTIPGFYQGHHANVTIAGYFTTAGGFPVDSDRGFLLQADIAKQNVPLLIRVNVKARLKVGALTTPSFDVHVNCDVGIQPPTPAVGTTPGHPATVLRKTCKRV